MFLDNLDFRSVGPSKVFFAKGASPLCIVFHEWCFQEMNFHFKFAEGEKYKLGSNIFLSICLI